MSPRRPPVRREDDGSRRESVKASATPRPTLVHRIHIQAGPDQVWRAITDPRYTEQYFFGLAARSDWRRGARIVYETLRGEPQMTGELLELDAPRRLSYSVRLLRDAETAADLPSRVTWEIVPLEEGGCELTVVHEEFEGETPTYRSVKRGWPLALAGLKELLETGQARQAQAAWPEHLERPPRFQNN